MNDSAKPLSFHVLLWMGAAVSIAEIMTGTYFAGLGFERGLFAIVLGHLIGGVLFFLAGYMGARQRKSAMETVKNSFGFRGGLWFALLNVVQLCGWTAIMIYDGALAANGIWSLGHGVWCAMIGGLIVLWLILGQTHLAFINRLAVLGLLMLTVLLSLRLFSPTYAAVAGEAISLGAAIELAAVMPLSWLPLVSDYTRNAHTPWRTTLVSSAAYGVMSIWMYAIGLGMALYAQETDFAHMLLKLGLGAAGLLLIVFSTVTTTFLDAFSAGMSAKSMFKKLPEKSFTIVLTIICMLAAMMFPMNNITEFLFFIGSVFAPMVAIQIFDFFILKRDESSRAWVWNNLIIWLLGFVLYRYWLAHPLAMGNTLPVMAATMILCAINHIVLRSKSRY